MSYQNTMDSSEVIGGAFTPTGPTGAVGSGGGGAGPTGQTGEAGAEYSRSFSIRGNNSTSKIETAILRTVTTIGGSPIIDSGISFVGGGGRVTNSTGIAGLYKITMISTLGVQGPFADEWEILCYMDFNGDNTPLPGSQVRFTVNGENGVARRRTWQRTILVDMDPNDYVRCIATATDTGGGGGTATHGGDARFNMELVDAD